jgi:hypothetical protein
MMDVESQAMPASQEAAPADAPRDGIARGTEGSPDENRPATVAGSPAAAPPPAKRARTAATEGVKSFDGAKQFIAQLREAERAPPAEPHAEPHARDPARETRFAETASPRTGTRVVPETGSRVKDAIETTSAEANGIADGKKETDGKETPHPLDAREETETGGSRERRRTEPAPNGKPATNATRDLDAFEEDAVHVLSGLFEEDLSQALSDAGTVRLAAANGGKKRRSSVGAGRRTADTRVPDGTAAGSLSIDGNGDKRGNRSGGATTNAGAGPSSSRKAADHRRLLKSYMKALFRHLRLPVDIKPADAATYRDRINSALGFWFGETFSPGRTTVECNAPKVVAALFYLATFGRVDAGVDDVARVLRKGPQAKNANYAVDETELVRLGVSVAELRAMFEGPARYERGFPRGVPLALPDLDALPAPAAPARGAAFGAEEKKSEKARAETRPGPSRPGPSRPGPSVRVAKKKPRDAARDAGLGVAVGSGAPPPNAALESRNPNGAKSSDETDAKTEAARAEGAGESGGGAAAADAKTQSRVASTPRAPDANGGSPLFSPLGGVTAAFAAAALMPSAGDRGAEVAAFLEKHVAPALDALDAHPVETQLEMLNCAQGAFVTRAASLAKAQHRASRAADEREGLRGAGPPPAEAVPRGKRGRGKR